MAVPLTTAPAKAPLVIEPLETLAVIPFPAVAAHTTVAVTVLCVPSGQAMVPVTGVVAFTQLFLLIENVAVPLALPFSVPVTEQVPVAWYMTGLPGSLSVFTTVPLPFRQVMDTGATLTARDCAAGAAVAVAAVPASTANSP
ncbi:hypothetical protein [Streptomyces sp. YGL11-2]|uniref:hypothetical protein n=1 Tax=Streptomyces sp. YGL11-2 TaxID=3414028 RepID=UPI003CF8A5C0